jgi:putative transposase
MAVPRLPDDRWSLDFVSDQLASSRRFRILSIFDDCTRECLAAVADISSGRRVGARTRSSDRQARQPKPRKNEISSSSA